MGGVAKKTLRRTSVVGRKFPVAEKSMTGQAIRRDTKKKPRSNVESRSIWDKLALWAGKCKGLPSDLARNHDHYLHGLPKR